MSTAVGIPQAEVLIRLIAEMVLYFLAIPVTLPGEGFTVPYTAAEDHLAMNLTCRQTAGSTAREDRAEEHRTLGIDRMTLIVAELIPYIIVGSRHLMAVIGLNSEEVGVVTTHTVTDM